MISDLATVPASARRLNRHEISGLHGKADLTVQGPAIAGIPARLPRFAAVQSVRTAPASIGENRHFGRLEKLELLDDAIAAAALPCST